MTDVKYQCRECGKTVIIPEDQEAPECCGEKMELLHVCTTAPSAEHARWSNEDDPCDESLSGKRI